MSTEEEINNAVDYLASKNVDFTLLHCHSAYPAPPHHLNLSYIVNLQSKCSNPVGYSSHDVGHNASLIALALGAKVFEKHITLDKNGFGNDNSVSLEPDELKSYVEQLNNGSKMLTGLNSHREIGPGEKFNRISLSKSIITLKALKSGQLLDFDNIEFYPSGEGLTPYEVEKLCDVPLIKDLAVGEVISKHHFIRNTQSDILTALLKYKAGIPVRYRDMMVLFERFKLSFHEIHLSCNDLEFDDFASIPLLRNNRAIGFHAPDIYENNLIFDPTASNKEIASSSIVSFERVLRHIQAIIKNLTSLVELT